MTLTFASASPVRASTTRPERLAVSLVLSCAETDNESWSIEKNAQATRINFARCVGIGSLLRGQRFDPALATIVPLIVSPKSNNYAMFVRGFAHECEFPHGRVGTNGSFRRL